MKKDIKFYVIYSIIILLFIVSSANILNMIEDIAQKTYNPFLLGQISFSFLFLFGVMLGVESLFNRRKKKGTWKFNFLRLAILGGPTMIMIIWFWFPRLFGFVLINAFFPHFFSNSIVYNFSVTLFGWVLATCFYKNDKLDLGQLE